MSWFPYQLQFKFPFKIAHGTRTHTPVVYVKVEHEGLVGWGEASLPPYLKETQQSVITFLEKFNKDVSSRKLEEWIEKLLHEKSNMPAKAALDMALWQIKARIMQKSIRQLLNVEEKVVLQPNSFYTISSGTKREMQEKIAEGLRYRFELFKLKLTGTEYDYTTVHDFTSLCNKGFGVDMNGAYHSEEEAIRFIRFVKEKGALVIEQPMGKTQGTETLNVRKKTQSLMYADESCQGIEDMELVAENFGGVNIKLMKCGGLTAAYQMLQKAQELGVKTLIGCMSESSVGCWAAGQLAPLAHWLDLDGPYLIDNDPFVGIQVEKGNLMLQHLVLKPHSFL
ncbi:MAG: hypothetical protein JST67_01580 [Bacteroidetes bacterium]|nr:hypothetical protein [Bacteroidota bacterium]